MRFFDRLAGFPLLIWVYALMLCGLGAVFLDSASGASVDGDPGQAVRQVQAVLLSALLAAVLAGIRRRKLLQAAWPLYFAACLALASLPFLGVTLNGARRWFRLGGLTLQPAEFFKPALILVLAHWYRLRSEGGFRSTVLLPLLFTVLPAASIARQPDLGSALSLFPILLVMAWAAGARARHLLLLLGAGILALLAFYPFLHSYQKERILVWLHQGAMTREELKGAGYHLYQSLIAVGGGGWFGAGLRQGPQNVLDYLPYRSTDFLFSVVAEETGILGASAVVFLYLGLGVLLCARAARLGDRFGRLLSAGAGGYFLTHLFLHAGVCTGLLPPTGLPLPFLSYGRSSVAGAWLVLALAGHATWRRVRTVAPDRHL